MLHSSTSETQTHTALHTSTWPSPTTATHGAASFSCAALLTSAVSQAVQDVAFVAQALEAAGVVDARVVARPLEGALIDICRAAHTDAFRENEVLHRTEMLPTGATLGVSGCKGRPP